MSADSEPPSFSAASYFATQLPPASLEHDVEGVREFVARQAQEGRRVVLVTVSMISWLIRPHNLGIAFRAVEPLFLWSSMCEDPKL